MVSLKIAVPVNRNDKKASVFEHFGRAPYYMIVSVENGEILGIEYIKNPLVEHQPGEIPDMLRRNGVNVIICMGMGRRARSVFANFGIEVVGGASGNALDCIKNYLEGKLRDIEYYPETKWHQENQHS